MLLYNGAKIQIFDLPGLITGASKGKGRGREILSAIRNVDLILIMLDAYRRDHLEIIVKELHTAGIRLNQKKPDVVVNKTGQGGINFTATLKLSYLNENVIKAIASEYVINADIIIREDLTEDRFIDSFIQNRVYVPALAIINKIDMIDSKQLQTRINDLKQNGWKTISISAKDGIGINKLKEMIFSELKFIRIYMKPVGQQADMDEPLILKQGSTIEDVCQKLHREFKNKFRYANISGPSAKHDVQKVGLEHILQDGDILTMVVSK
jgi:ribosome-interacting GTPase 1